MGLNQAGTSPASLGDAFALGIGLPRTSLASMGDAFGLKLGLNQAANSMASFGDTFNLGFGLPRTSPASLGDAFALILGMNRTGVSSATVSDVFGLGIGSPRTSSTSLEDTLALGSGFLRTSLASLGDAFATNLGKNTSETSGASLRDTFGLGLGVNRTETSSATLTQSAVFTVQRNSVPDSAKEGGGGAPRPKFDSRGLESLIDALEADLGESVRIRDIKIRDRHNGLLIDVRVIGMNPDKKSLGDMRFELGRLQAYLLEGRGFADQPLSDHIVVHSDVTSEITDEGFKIAVVYKYLRFTPEVPPVLPGSQSDAPTLTGVSFRVDLNRLRTNPFLEAEFSNDPDSFLLDADGLLASAAVNFGAVVEDITQDVTTLVKVTTRNIAADDLGSINVSLSVLTSWYESRVAEGKSFIIFKADDFGSAYGSLASCQEDLGSVTCVAEFSGRAGGFSVFGLLAIVRPDELAQIIPTTTMTPTSEADEGPAPTSTAAPTLEATPAPSDATGTPPPDASATPIPTATRAAPTVGGNAVTPTIPQERVQGQIVGKIVPTSTPSAVEGSTPTTTFVRLMSPTPTSLPERGPTVSEADLPSGNLTLPAYLGIAISLVFVIIGGAAYVYRIRLSLYLENGPYRMKLSRILTYLSSAYYKRRREKAKSEWESARKFHRQASDRYLNDNKGEDLQEAETRRDKAFIRLRRAIAEDIISLASHYGKKRRRPK